jgi:hypothetical protein
MRRTPSLVSLLAGLCLGGALFVVGCRQGANDRCEVDNDCQTGLLCIRSAMKDDGICKGSVPDAAVIADAGGAEPVRPTDVAPADATGVTAGAIDASVDAAVDAAAAAAADAGSDAPTDGASDLAALVPDASSN